MSQLPAHHTGLPLVPSVAAYGGPLPTSTELHPPLEVTASAYQPHIAMATHGIIGWVERKNNDGKATILYSKFGLQLSVCREP